MAMKVVGIGRSSGEFEGHKYDNFVIHGLEGDKNVTGQRATSVKVKAEIFHRDLSPVVNADLMKLVGQTVECDYDRYGKVQGVRLLASK